MSTYPAGKLVWLGSHTTAGSFCRAAKAQTSGWEVGAGNGRLQKLMMRLMMI